MTVTLPAPYGKADWTDYVDYWRDADVTWMQDRLILRYADVATRNTSLSAATAGHPVYVAANDRLEFKSTLGNWIGVLGAQNIKISPVNNTGGGSAANESVTLSQVSSTGGNGLVLGKDLTSFTTDTDLNGVLKVTGVGAAGHVDIKSGTQTVKLTTDATGLVSDKPIAATSFTAPLATITTVNATTLTATGAVSGATVTGTTSVGGGVLTMASGTVGAVTMATGRVTGADGVRAQQGAFIGTAGAARVHQWTGSALGASYLEVTPTVVTAFATDFAMDAQLKVYDIRPIQFYSGSPGTLLGYGGPVVYNTGTLVAANYPPGTIWIS